MSIEHSPADDAVERVRVRILPDGRMSRRDASKYLGVKQKTLAMWALAGKGPPSVKVGGRRFYYKEVLDAFIRGDAA
ncbi:MAG: helix-turn-helix domain-containing protein [Alphaproteobacteria bacterium]|nr:helix-turn-helix domain-containing protein [Alphaproteobacteria bacterium]